jgi:hypothetical protein
LYPIDSTLPTLAEAAIVNVVDNPDTVFLKESDTFEAHPAANLGSTDPIQLCQSATSDCPCIFLESTGVFDCDGLSIPARHLTSSALNNLVSSDKASDSAPWSPPAMPQKLANIPDLVLH